MSMEKNAVVGPKNHNKNDKTASYGCPKCGAAVDRSGSIPRCPVHGTAPFEPGGNKNGR